MTDSYENPIPEATDGSSESAAVPVEEIESSTAPVPEGGIVNVTESASSPQEDVENGHEVAPNSAPVPEEDTENPTEGAPVPQEDTESDPEDAPESAPVPSREEESTPVADEETENSTAPVPGEEIENQSVSAAQEGTERDREGALQSSLAPQEDNQSILEGSPESAPVPEEGTESATESAAKDDTESDPESAPVPECFKTSVVDDLLCPINLDLPFVPVVAEDGRVYDREAIEQHFATSSNERIKSPMNGEMIGKKLLAAPWIKSHIEALIENGIITGDLAEKWKEKEQQKKEMEDLLKKAGGGDVWSIERVALNYELAKDGFKQDDKMAYKWYEKARVAGTMLGMAKVGEFLSAGFGVTKDKEKAMMYLAMAAGMGSDLGAYILGLYLADGLYGFPVDKVEARKLLEKSLSGNCPYKNIHDEAKQAAQQKLDELINDQA